MAAECPFLEVDSHRGTEAFLGGGNGGGGGCKGEQGFQESWSERKQWNVLSALPLFCSLCSAFFSS